MYSTAYAHEPEDIRQKAQGNTLVYEYIDHIDPQISGDKENIKRLNALKDFAFNGGADYIVASAQKLYDEAVAAVGVEKVIFARNGVDVKHYKSPAHDNYPIPANILEFKNKYKNIVGYFGAMAPWLWYDVVNELVSNRPDLGFIFIGPDYYGGIHRLSKADNVLYLGTVDYKILPAYARLFDVCFIPFEPGEIARTTSPLKLFEYFALQKPVVVTDEMRECTFFNEVFRGNSANSLSHEIDNALSVKDDVQFELRLLDLANQNSWAERAKAMQKAFN